VEADFFLSQLGIGKKRFSKPFFDSLYSNCVVLIRSSERYENEMEELRKSLGIEMNTLSANMQLFLSPSLLYDPPSPLEEAARKRGVTIRTKGPQAILFLLDGIPQEAENKGNFTANLLFINHLTGALLEKRYPFEKGERPIEFQQIAREGLEIVKDYLRKLEAHPDLGKGLNLAPRIARIASLDENGLDQEAQKITLCQTLAEDE